MITPTLTTERLVLRPVRVDDAPAVQHHFGRWEIIANLSTQVPWPYPPDGAVTWLRDLVLPQVEAGAAMLWAITVRAVGDECVGILEWRISGAEDADNRGFWLAVEHQGQGYMTEAVTAFQDWLFTATDTERIFVLNASVNPRSRRIKEKTGGRFVGLTHLEHHGGATETERWEVTRAAWRALRGL